MTGKTDVYTGYHLVGQGTSRLSSKVTAVRIRLVGINIKTNAKFVDSFIFNVALVGRLLASYPACKAEYIRWFFPNLSSRRQFIIREL
jgi:hypothetical protein